MDLSEAQLTTYEEQGEDGASVASYTPIKQLLGRGGAGGRGGGGVRG